MTDFCNTCIAPQYVTPDGEHHCGEMLPGHHLVNETECVCGEYMDDKIAFRAHLYEVGKFVMDLRERHYDL